MPCRWPEKCECRECREKSIRDRMREPEYRAADDEVEESSFVENYIARILNERNQPDA